MSRPRISLLAGLGVLGLAVGCSGTDASTARPASPASSSPPAVSTAPTAALLASTTLDQADKRMHALLADVTATAARQVNSPSLGALAPVDEPELGCHTLGTARHRAVMSVLGGSDAPDTGPDVRRLLQDQGWKFTSWQEPDPVRRNVASRARLEGFSLVVSYRPKLSQTNVLITTPCLKGEPLAERSFFPHEFGSDS
ncbi:hypothetical protein ACFQLX_12480 [Streptomyces polyrhachis]|uniref:Lipoprotein n=1 Tax=Streptomyces polyrhachis TaxID=1282885 RepID=A0ABW2GE28_9ACTN